MLSWVSPAHSACCVETWHPALQTRVPGAKWPHLSSESHVQRHCTQHCDLELQAAKLSPPVRTLLPPRWQPCYHTNHINLYLYHIDPINSPAVVGESMYSRPQAPSSHALMGIKCLSFWIKFLLLWVQGTPDKRTLAGVWLKSLGNRTRRNKTLFCPITEYDSPRDLDKGETLN